MKLRKSPCPTGPLARLTFSSSMGKERSSTPVSLTKPAPAPVRRPVAGTLKPRFVLSWPERKLPRECPPADAASSGKRRTNRNGGTRDRMPSSYALRLVKLPILSSIQAPVQLASGVKAIVQNAGSLLSVPSLPWVPSFSELFWGLHPQHHRLGLPAENALLRSPIRFRIVCRKARNPAVGLSCSDRHCFRFFLS